MLFQLFGAAPPALGKAPPRLKISDRIPDVSLLDQFGKPLRFREAFIDDGRALIINTMYATCRGSCPGTSKVLKSLRKSLSTIFKQRLTFVSITLDPAIDQPKTLRAYAENFGANERSESLCPWQFVTGTAANIEQLRRALGFFDLDPAIDSDITQHGSTLLIGNSTTDRWAAMPAGLPKSQLVSSICRVAGFTFKQKYGNLA